MRKKTNRSAAKKTPITRMMVTMSVERVG